jgi:sugar-specific transcriptional regulator TrmB
MTKIHKDINEFLTSWGLTPTEISLYVTGLQHGPQTTSEFAKRSGVKRTTAQSALSTMQQKGMVSRHAQSGVSRYIATDPQHLEWIFSEQIDNLKKQQFDFINLLPLFEDLTDSVTVVTEVSQYQGLEGVKTAVDTALFCVSRQWKIIAPERNFFSETDPDYADYFIKVRAQRGIRAQSLWEPDFVRKRKFYYHDFEFRDPRVLPKPLVGKFKVTIIIFDASVLFISSVNTLSAVLIKSEEIHDTMEVFFDGLWLQAKQIPKNKVKR